MSPDEMATVVDINGRQVVVVTEEVARNTIRGFLVWFLTAGLVLLVSSVVSITAAWRDIRNHQDSMAAEIKGWATRAPAPADTTRIALRYLDGRITVLEADVQQLRRDLRRPR